MKAEPATNYTLHELRAAARDDLEMCQTDSERGMCAAICAREIINRAGEIESTRALTDGERAIVHAARRGNF